MIGSRGSCLPILKGRSLVPLIVFASALPMTAQAGSWDLNLSRLCQIKTNSGTNLDCGRVQDFAAFGGISRDNPIQPDDESFRSVMSELGVIFAPDVLSPAETLGFGGFHVGIQFGHTTINRLRDANPDIPELRHRFWRAAEAVSDAAYATGDSIYDEAAKRRIDDELPSTFAHTVTFMVRKGFWFPLPSFEIGAGVKHLFGSKMWSAIVTAKLALHEGFQGLPLPALAVRGTGSRVFGTEGFGLTLGALDASISKAFGVGSTFTLTPYAGYQLLWIVATSDVIDAIPSLVATDLTSSRHFTFIDQGAILRHRIVAGFRLNFYIAALLVEFSGYPPGSSAARADVPDLRLVEVNDESGGQYSISSSLAIEF